MRYADYAKARADRDNTRYDSLDERISMLEQVTADQDALTRYANELTGKQDGTLTEATETLIKHFKEE